MPRQVTSAFRNLANAIREFTIAQRTVAIIGLAVLILGVIALGVWITKPSYTPLFSGLSGADANTLVEQLRGDGVPYELSNGGATIMVPEANVYDERIKASAAGLPSSTTGGYSLLDTMGVTASEFQQDVTYKRALEGELAKTISALKGVKMASVQLAIPEETVFVSEKNDPTASVFVETQSGVTLTSDQVQAIVHLTSASIDGMAPTDVAVIDSSGTVLSAVGEGATGGADQQVSDYEAAIRASVQTMLDKVVGAGNATVVVSADMSQESAQRVEETFEAPDGTIALNESATVDNTGGASGQTAAGVLGPDNIAVPSDAALGSGDTSSSSITRNNAINKVTESTTIPAGALTRKTVSVALNQGAAKGLNVEDVTALVGSAAGIDEERGDIVTVAVVPFNGAGAAQAKEALEAAAAAASADRFADLIRTGVIVLGIALPIIIALAVFAARSKRRKQEVDEAADLADLRSILNDTQPAIQTPAYAAIPTVPTSPMLIEPSTMDRTRAEIDALAAQDPQRAAEFLRGLMDGQRA